MSEKIKKAIKSAESVAALRAATFKEKDYLVKGEDYLAKHFLGLKYKLITNIRPQLLLKRVVEQISPGSYCFSIIRTRHFDKILLSEVKNGAKQVVILGAGYDTRAFRFQKKLSETKIFELDFPGTQKFKLKTLSNTVHKTPENIVFIPLNFNNDSFRDKLIENQFSMEKKTIFLWEGVSYYLPEPVVENVLSFVANCATGSSIVFDYATRDFVIGDHSTHGGKQIAKWLKKIKEPFLFGMNKNETNAFLERSRLQPVSDLGPEELERLYLKTSKGKLLGKTLGHVRMAHARTL